MTNQIRELLEQARIPIDPRRSLERHELGDAELFRDLMRDLVLFDHAEQRWYRWNKLYWVPDLTGDIQELLPNLLIARYGQEAKVARNRGDRQLVKRFSRRCQELGRARRVDNVLRLASRLHELKLRGDEWAIPPMQLPVANGIIDLTTGRLREGEPSDRIRVHAPTKYFGLHHPAPLWERLLHDIFDGKEEVISYFRRLVGYAISGARTEQILPILYGAGANGKSTIIEAIFAVLGPDLTFHTQPESLQDTGKADGNAARPFIATLRDRRLVVASESRDGARLNTGLVKQLTGDHLIAARDLYAKPVMFKQTYTIFLVTNHRPSLPDGSDEAMWRRMQLVPFEQKFVDEPQAPNEHKRERNLLERLQAEASGILACMVRGALECHANGLNPPAVVMNSTAEYRADEDVIGQYISERLVVGEGLEVAAGEVYRYYKAWCEEMGCHPASAQAFGMRMSTRFGKTEAHWHRGRTTRLYTGVAVHA